MADFHYQRITIIRSRRPAAHTLNDELKWLGQSLGLFGLRDKDKSCYRVFVELIKSTRRQKPLSSDDLAMKLDLSRGTVVHHLNRLREAGIVVTSKNLYLIRVDNLRILIDELQKDMERAFTELREVAAQIDKELGL